jgi:hypothetical protein
MPWIKCGECRRVILVMDDPPPVSFLCQKCIPLFCVIWDHFLTVQENPLTLNRNDYSPVIEKIMQGLGIPGMAKVSSETVRHKFPQLGRS